MCSSISDIFNASCTRGPGATIDTWITGKIGWGSLGPQPVCLARAVKRIIDKSRWRGEHKRDELIKMLAKLTMEIYKVSIQSLRCLICAMMKVNIIFCLMVGRRRDIAFEQKWEWKNFLIDAGDDVYCWSTRSRGKRASTAVQINMRCEIIMRYFICWRFSGGGMLY